MRRLGPLAVVALGLGSARPSPAAPEARDRPPAWATATASPAPLDLQAPKAHVAGDDDLWERALYGRCGAADARLRAVAAWVLARKLAGRPAPERDDLVWALRATGEPHVWPRAWVLSGRGLERDATLVKLAAWRGAVSASGEARCGAATGVGADGVRFVAVISVDALADLSALPTRARAGQWLTVEARLLVPTTAAKVVVLGPGGLPRPVPTALTPGDPRSGGAVVKARFAPERPGAFTVQVMADVAAGPRPVLEARVFAEIEPPNEPPSSPPPASRPADSDDLASLVHEVRREAGLRPLRRDARLDALARAHAERMAAARSVGHDVGDGDPLDRLREAGVDVRAAGENAARAGSALLAHRSLLASPSHRANLLRPEYDSLGIAVVPTEARGDGAQGVWVVELFAQAR